MVCLNKKLLLDNPFEYNVWLYNSTNVSSLLLSFMDVFYHLMNYRKTIYYVHINLLMYQHFFYVRKMQIILWEDIFLILSGLIVAYHISWQHFSCIWKRIHILGGKVTVTLWISFIFYNILASPGWNKKLQNSIPIIYVKRDSWGLPLGTFKISNNY